MAVPVLTRSFLGKLQACYILGLWADQCKSTRDKPVMLNQPRMPSRTWQVISRPMPRHDRVGPVVRCWIDSAIGPIV
eukprot:8528233-Lingulodinium_polyedra.AAC.1